MLKPLFKILPFLIGLLLVACSEEKTTTESTEAPTQVEKPAVTRTADYKDSKNAYFGDLHVHTSWSFDAFIYNVRTTPNDAYDFGSGKMIDHVSGNKIQLGRPLDFMAVTDHAEYKIRSSQEYFK